MTRTPDHVPCRHCGESISWDDVCWTHDSTGFADCGMEFIGALAQEGIMMNPQLKILGPYKGEKAEPIGEWN